MLKFATFQVTSAVLVPKGVSQDRLRRIARRHEFKYDVRPGYLYVKSRAISSRTNDNYDEFPAEEIEKGYQTFVGKPVFVNHVNDNHRRARGVIIDAALHKDSLSDGSPDTWVEVLMEIDAVRFPKLAKAILDKRIDRTSMGVDVERSQCSACGNWATSPVEYCVHIPKMKGKKMRKRGEDGTLTDHLIRETCYGLSFFENSVLVEPPADPTAHFLGVDDSGVKKAASKTASREEDREEAKRRLPEAWHDAIDSAFEPGFEGPRMGIDEYGPSDRTWSDEEYRQHLREQHGRSDAEIEQFRQGIISDHGNDTNHLLLHHQMDHEADEMHAGVDHTDYIRPLNWQDGHKHAAYMPEKNREITRSNEHGSWKVKHSIDGGTHPVDDNPVAQMALRAGQDRAIHYFHPGHGYGVETSDGPILDTDGSRYHATSEGAIAAQWHHEKATGQIFHPLFLDKSDSTKASPAGEDYYSEREKARQDMHGWRSENDKGYQADLMHDRLTLPMRPDAPRMSDEAKGYLDSNPTGPTKYSSLMAHFASLDDDSSNHLFKGEPGGKCYCGDEEAYHPHPSAGQWARCSTCGKDMSHHLHDQGRYEHLKHQESLPPGHSQMMMEHIFGEYGQDYGVDNPAPSKHDTEKALAEQMKGLGGDDADWLLDQQEGKPSKYSSLMRHFAAQDTPSVSGVVLKAADTGRVLMIQRSHKDESDPARGTWEFPGGHHEEGDTTSLHAGIREWEEEVGQPFPEGGVVSHTWRSPNGIYQGHVVVIPEESAVSLKDGRSTVNPDDPDGDDHEQAAWWDPKHAEKNPALRKEVKKAPWNELRKTAGRHHHRQHHHHRTPAHHPYYHPQSGWRGGWGGVGWFGGTHGYCCDVVNCGGGGIIEGGGDVGGGDMGAEASRKSASRQFGQRDVWPVRVHAHDRETGKIIGHVSGYPKSEGYEQVSRAQFPFRLCSAHLKGLEAQVKDHNDNAPNHPHRYSVHTDTWPLDPTNTEDISSCNACTISAVNDIFSKQASEQGGEERIPISDEDRALYEQIANHSQHRMEQWQHAEKRVVDLNDPLDLRQHMIESHDFTDGDFWRNSHAKDHPALPKSTDVDRPLSHKEIRALHDHDHTSGDYAGTTLGDSHFHTAVRKTSGMTLYRGEGDHDRPSYYPETGPSALAGAWWTSDPESAQRYAQSTTNGQVYRLDDVQDHEAEQSGRPGNYLVRDPEVRGRRVPHVAGRKQAASDLTRHEVLASDVQQGDFLDISGKVRVHQTRTANGQTTLAYKVRGSKAPGIRIHPEDKAVYVWRRGLKNEAVRKEATWIGDHPEEPSLFWRAPKTQRWEVHIHNYTPDRQLREQYGAKPTQDVTLLHAGNKARTHPDYHGPNMGAWHVSRDPHTLELSYKANGWGAHPIGETKPPPHVEQQVHNALNEVERHAENHAELHGMIADMKDMEEDSKRAEREHEQAGRGQQMFRNLLNSANESTCHHCDGEGNTERGPKTCGMCDGNGFLKKGRRTTAAFLSKGDAVWAKPSGEYPEEKMQQATGGADRSDGPFHLTRHPENRAHQLVDRQNRLLWSTDGSDGSNDEYHAPNYLAETFHELNQSGGHHSPLPYKTDDYAFKPEPERSEIGKELFRRERGIGEHAPAFEHSTTDPRQADLESRPAPRKDYPVKAVQQSSSREHGTTYRQVRHGEPGYDDKGAFYSSSPSDEWHGPYEVIQHPETNKYHVVDNQGRDAGSHRSRGFDDLIKAQDARDTVDRRTQSREKARKMADDLYEGFAQIVDPGSTPESRQSDRHSRSMSELMGRYEGGTHHPLTPGRFGADGDEHEDDGNGSPYYEVKDPGGSGWTARDYGGGHIDIHHEARPHEQIDRVHPDGSTQGGWNEKGTKPVGFGHEELHAELQNWIHGDPNEPEDERYAPGKDYARAYPHIEQWQKRKGYRG